MIDNVYTCLLRDGNRRTVLQPFIAYDDDSAIRTVKNAIREDANIRAIAMQERISLHKVCEIITSEDEITVESLGMLTFVADNEHFRRYAQTVYADEARQRANEAEAEVMADPETKEAFYHDICETTQIPSDEYMKGEIEND